MKKYISNDRQIMGGTPVIGGTRVPISIILYRLKEGYSLEQIHDMYRHVPIKLLQKVIEELADRMSQPVGENDQIQAFPQA